MAEKKKPAKKVDHSPAKLGKKVPAKVGELVFQRHDKDTGSPEVQAGLLSSEIAQLQAHLGAHKKDYDAKRSLLKKVAKRRKFLKYLKDKNLDTYSTVSKKLDLKV
jgi:small subunit ribosomal protein S15